MTREGTADDPPRGPENTPRIVDRTKNNVTIVPKIPSQDPSPRLPPHSYPPRGTSNCRSGSRAPQDPISSRLGSLAPSNDRSLPEPLRSRFVLSTCCATPGASSSIDGATGDLTLYLSNARASAPWNDVKASLRPQRRLRALGHAGQEVRMKGVRQYCQVVSVECAAIASTRRGARWVGGHHQVARDRGPVL